MFLCSGVHVILQFAYTTMYLMYLLHCGCSEYCFVTNTVNLVVVLYGKHRFMVNTVRLLEYCFVVSTVTSGQEHFFSVHCQELT